MELIYHFSPYLYQKWLQRLAFPFFYRLLLCTFSAHRFAMRFVTYNLLNDHPKFAQQPTKNWADRRPHLIQHLKALAPEVLAIQEGRPQPLDDLRQAFPHWAYRGEAAGGPYGGEQAGFFFNATLWEGLDFQTTWLSPTPERPSKGWDARHHRVLSHLTLRQRDTGTIWHCFNTHLDAHGKIARLKGMAYIIGQLDALLTPSPQLNLLFCGDFNAAPQSPTYRLLRDWGGVLDARQQSQTPPQGPAYTFAGVDARWTWQRLGLHLGYPRYMHRRIDHLFVAPAITVQHYRTSAWTYAQNRQYPSDHLPIVADLVGHPPNS